MLGPGKRFTEFLDAGKAAGTPVAELQAEILADGELLLDYYVGIEASLVLAVSPDTLAFRSLPGRPELEERLKSYHRLLNDPGASSATTLATVSREVAGELLAGLEPLVAASRQVIVSPDDAVNLVPFGEWEVPESQVGERAESGALWVRVPSASILAGIRRSAAGREAPRDWTILAVGGSTGPDGTPLPGSRREVQDLANRLAGVRIARPATSPLDSCLSLLTGGDLLHIAAHARVHDRSPWNSAILLDTEAEPEPLRATRIAALNLDAHLAVLSSCKTAAGRILSGEGVTGLTSAFFSAGVPTVLASLWPVDDAVTVELMRVFYAELAEGEDVATALAAARQEIRRNPATAHPAYWAGFIVAGEGGLEPLLKVRKPMALRIALGATAVLLVVLLWRSRRRQ